MSYERPFRLRMAPGLSVLVAACIGAAAAPDAAAPDAATRNAALPGVAEVQLIGRAQLSAGVWRVTWPGVGWRTAFSGPRVGITTLDSVGYGVTIDGLTVKPIPPSQTRLSTWYLGLSAGNHSIEVIRMRATPRTPGLFFGFSKGIDGSWLALPLMPERQIEFIADSSTTGYGDLSTTVDCTDDETASRSDASQSYAILAAHQLNADWQLNAMDGIGVVRNWHGIWKGTNYATYGGLTLQSEPASRYRDSNWHPQVAVVRIGTNDFGSPLEAGEPWTPAQLEAQFTDGYRKLLIGLRGRLGPDGLIVVIQPAFGDNPANQKVAQIVDSLRSAGDQRLYTLQFPPLELTGCGHHPNLSDHRLMGATLVKFIDDHAGAELH
jgi:lysophospholipase L1-like esterase